MGNFKGKYKSLYEIKGYSDYSIDGHDSKWNMDTLTIFDKDLLKRIDEINKTNIKIVELGCEARCKIYHMLTKHSTSKLEKYYGVDIPNLLTLSPIKNNENVFLTHNVYDIKEKIDIFYSNSSLQYIINSYDFLTHILTLSPQYIILNITPFTIEDDFITLQIQRGGAERIPYKFLNREKFLSFIKKHDYELISENIHYKMSLENCTADNLVFKKIIYEDHK